MDLSTIEVYKIAQNIEQDGIRFYQKAAEFSLDEVEASLFEDLVDMEAQHYNTFLKLEEEHSDSIYFDSEEIKEYLRDNFNSDLFQADQVAEEWKDIHDSLDIFKKAKVNEDKTIRFYSLILDKVKQSETREILKNVIDEEKEHSRLMQKYIEGLSQ